jgi:hypothetical protein
MITYVLFTLCYIMISNAVYYNGKQTGGPQTGGSYSMVFKADGNNTPNASYTILGRAIQRKQISFRRLVTTETALRPKNS